MPRVDNEPHFTVSCPCVPIEEDKPGSLPIRIHNAWATDEELLEKGYEPKWITLELDTDDEIIIQDEEGNRLNPEE
jgi:hypothetical protein